MYQRYTSIAVNKYPTLKLFVNGELITKEYRSTRSVEALTAFVREQLQTTVKEFHVVGYARGLD